MDKIGIQRLSERIKFPDAAGIWYYRNKRGISDLDLFNLYIEDLSKQNVRGTITDRYGRASFEGVWTKAIVSFKKRYETRRDSAGFDYHGTLIGNYLYQGNFSDLSHKAQEEQGFIIKITPDLLGRL